MIGQNIGAMYATLGVDASGVMNAQKAMLNLQRTTMTAVNQMNTSLRTLGTQVGKVQAQMNNTSSTKGLVATNKEVTNSFQKFGQSIEKNAMALRSFGWLATTVLTVPILGAGKAALTAYSDFEYSMLKIVGLVGIAREQVTAWEGDVRKMGKEIGRSPLELADALYFVTSSGFKTAEALNILELSAKASVAGLGDVKSIADLTTSVMNAYGQQNITASKTLDILTAAVREGKGEATDYAKVLGSVVPFAAQLKVSFDQVAGAVAAMTLQGASAANSATYLRNIFMKLIKPAKGSEQALRMMGSSTAELRKILTEQGLMPALQKIRQLTNDYGEDMMGLVIPNIRSMLAELMLTGPAFEKNMKIMKATAMSAGDMAKAYQAVYDSVKNRLARANATLKDSWIELGAVMKDAVLPFLEILAKSVNNLAKWFAALDKSTQSWVLGIAGLLAVLGPLSLILSVVELGLLRVWKMIEGTGKAFLWLRSLSLGNVTLFKSMPVAIGPVVKIFNAFKTGVIGIGAGLGSAIGVLGGVALAMINYKNKVIASQKENSAFLTTLVKVNGEIKKIGQLDEADFGAMGIKQTQDYNMWAQKRAKNDKEWITYWYRLNGLSKEQATWATNIIEIWDKADPASQKKAKKLAGNWWDVIGIKKADLLDANKMIEESGKVIKTFQINQGELTAARLGALPPVFDARTTLNLLTQQVKMLDDTDRAYRQLGIDNPTDVAAEKLKLYNAALSSFIVGEGAASKNSKDLTDKIKQLVGDEAYVNMMKEWSKATNEYSDGLAKLNTVKDPFKIMKTSSSFSLDRSGPLFTPSKPPAFNPSLIGAYKEQGVISAGVRESLAKQAYMASFAGDSYDSLSAQIGVYTDALSNLYDLEGSKRSPIAEEYANTLKNLQKLQDEQEGGIITNRKFLDLKYKMEIEAAEKTGRDTQKITQKYLREVHKQKMQDVQTYLNAFSEGITAVSNLLEASKQRELSIVGDNAKAREEIEKRFFQKQKAFAIAQAIINGALAITNMLANVPGSAINPATWVGIAMSTVATAAQIAIIAGQRMAAGGVVPAGYPNDSYPARLTSGETVVPPGKLNSNMFENKSNGGIVVFEIEGTKLVGVLRNHERKTNSYR